MQISNFVSGSVSITFLFRYYVFVFIASKGHPRNDIYCVEYDVKPYTLTCVYYCVVIMLFVDVTWDQKAGVTLG